jgi:WD40 repeat protein
VDLQVSECVFGLLNEEQQRILLLNADHQFFTVSFEFVEGRSEQPVNVEVQSTTVDPGLPWDLKHFVRVSDTCFLALCNNDLECVLYDSGKYRKVPMSRQRITAISSTSSRISVSSADARTHIFRISARNLIEKFSIPTYRNSVLCSCLSKLFGVLVTGTDDQALIINLLADGSTLRVVHLDFVPQKVLVTHNWGFIVVHGCEYVQGKPRYRFAVFNINGVLVKSALCHHPVTHWLTVTSSRGFDFVIFSSEQGRLFAFEAFFLEIGAAIYPCKAELACLCFTSKSNTIIAVTVDGIMHMVPFLMESIEKYYA